MHLLTLLDEATEQARLKDYPQKSVTRIMSASSFLMERFSHAELNLLLNPVKPDPLGDDSFPERVKMLIK
jgi:hypothetical protein